MFTRTRPAPPAAPPPAPAPRQRPGTAWWRSLHLRIGVSFVLLVLGMAAIEGLLFTSTLQRERRDYTQWPHAVAMDTALTAAAALERSGTFDLIRYQRERYPAWPLMDIVLRDGRTISSSVVPLPDDLLVYTRQMLHGAPPNARIVPRIETRFLTAPIQHQGQLHGLVVLRFPPRTLLQEALRFVSLPGVVVLVAATAVASLVIFAPARRRLSALECAAERMRDGDLEARAPEAGGDEISRVAEAFNRMGEQLAERDAAIRRGDMLRRQMLADVSHELKTPLTAMRGFIETLQMPEIAADEARRTRYFATLERETRRLARLVADLVDVARLENGVADFEMRVFATRRLLDQVVRRHEPAASGAGVTLDVHVDPAVDQLLGDPHRLEQAVDNLVANALRYTPRGGRITMTAAAAGAFVAISVADTGPGIPAEHVGHVFDRFYKADPSRTASGEGSGLGLSIVRAVAERHGGDVQVASEPGRTVFTMRLPSGTDTADA